jgi:hypothetical protein
MVDEGACGAIGGMKLFSRLISEERRNNRVLEKFPQRGAS